MMKYLALLLIPIFQSLAQPGLGSEFAYASKEYRIAIFPSFDLGPAYSLQAPYTNLSFLPNDPFTGATSISASGVITMGTLLIFYPPTAHADSLHPQPAAWYRWLSSIILAPVSLANSQHHLVVVDTKVRLSLFLSSRTDLFFNLRNDFSWVRYNPGFGLQLFVYLSQTEKRMSDGIGAEVGCERPLDLISSGVKSSGNRLFVGIKWMRRLAP